MKRSIPCRIPGPGPARGRRRDPGAGGHGARLVLQHGPELRDARGNSNTMNFGINANLTRQWLRTAWRNERHVRAHRRHRAHAASRSALPTNFTVEPGRQRHQVGAAVRQQRPGAPRDRAVLLERGGQRRARPFAGLESRTIGAAGVGYLWQKPDKARALPGRHRGDLHGAGRSDRRPRDRGRVRGRALHPGRREALRRPPCRTRSLRT